jgi:hypothetical protein
VVSYGSITLAWLHKAKHMYRAGARCGLCCGCHLLWCFMFRNKYASHLLDLRLGL